MLFLQFFLLVNAGTANEPIKFEVGPISGRLDGYPVSVTAGATVRFSLITALPADALLMKAKFMPTTSIESVDEKKQGPDHVGKLSLSRLDLSFRATVACKSSPGKLHFQIRNADQSTKEFSYELPEISSVNGMTPTSKSIAGADNLPDISDRPILLGTTEEGSKNFPWQSVFARLLSLAGSCMLVVVGVLMGLNFRSSRPADSVSK